MFREDGFGGGPLEVVSQLPDKGRIVCEMVNHYYPDSTVNEAAYAADRVFSEQAALGIMRKVSSFSHRPKEELDHELSEAIDHVRFDHGCGNGLFLYGETETGVKAVMCFVMIEFRYLENILLLYGDASDVKEITRRVAIEQNESLR